MFHPLSHIYAKTPFCCVETVANNALNRWHVVVFDRLWANTAPTFNTAFSLTNIHAEKVNTLPSHIFNSSALSCNFNLLSAKKSLWSFFYVFRDNCWIWVTWAFSIICVCPTAFKVSLRPLNRCFWRRRVRITAFKLLLCLPIRKQFFINTQNSDFSIVLKIYNSNFNL